MNQYDHLKNKLHSYKVGIDKDELWKKTSHAIPKRKKRLVAPIILLAGLVTSAWLLHSNSLLPISFLSSDASKQTYTTDHTKRNLQENSFANTPDLTPPPNEIIEVLSSKISHSVSNLVSSKSSQITTPSSKSAAEGANAFSVDAKGQNVKIQLASLESSLEQDNHASPVLSTAENENIQKQNELKSGSGYSTGDEHSFSNLSQAQNDLMNTNHATRGPVDYLYKPISQIPQEVNTVVASTHEPIIRRRQINFLQSFQMGQGVGFSTVKIHSLKPESNQLASELEQKMSSLEILSTSASATLNLPARFSLEPGLQWTRLSTSIDHAWQTIERVEQEGISTIIIDENGIPQPITGNTIVTRTTHYQAKRFTEHNQIDVVLALHKVIWNANRLSLNAFLKGTYNLSYQAKGTTLTENGELMGFTKNEQPFRRKSPFAAGCGIQMNYYLNSHWSLKSSLVFDQLSYQFKDESIPIRFTHSGISLGLGIGYIF